ncbi:MAG: hypothetical protein ACREPX_12425 [Rhodanobacteraceae bacterium]
MGGGSGSSDRAQREADAAEAERQQQIAASTGAINAIYNDPKRQAQYDKLTSDTQKFYLTDLDKQKATNDRKLKFALARNGTIGGSVQTDQSRHLGEDYMRGVVEASRRAQSAGADLRSADEQSRMQLIGMASAGLDATTASGQATRSLQNDLLSSQAGATAGGLGDMFGDLSDIYRKSEDQKALRAGQKYAYNTTYQPIYGYGGGQSGGY